jgi:hypothetical protein
MKYGLHWAGANQNKFCPTTLVLGNSKFHRFPFSIFGDEICGRMDGWTYRTYKPILGIPFMCFVDRMHIHSNALIVIQHIAQCVRLASIHAYHGCFMSVRVACSTLQVTQEAYELFVVEHTVLLLRKFTSVGK